MRPLSCLAIGLSLVSCFLFLALVAELYYLLWWKKKIPNREMEESGYISPTKEFLYFFCWKKPSSLSSTALNPEEIATDGSSNDDQRKDLLIPFEEEGMEVELMRLHSLSGPPRFLFTIKEETKEDLESDDGKSCAGRSRRSSRGRSLSDVLPNAETPYLTPLSSPPFFTPPLTPMDCYEQQGFNPLFESKNCDEVMTRVRASPPPKFKFLRDAEEKLYKKTMTEEAMRVHKFGDSVVSPSKSKEEEDGSFITIIIGKSREKGHQPPHHPSSSQVNPLPSPPPIIRPAHGKLGSYLSSSD